MQSQGGQLQRASGDRVAMDSTLTLVQTQVREGGGRGSETWLMLTRAVVMGLPHLVYVHPKHCVCSHLHPVHLFRTQLSSITAGLDDRTRVCLYNQSYPTHTHTPQLSSVTAGLDERTRELADLTEYYDSMLQARIVDLCNLWLGLA